MAKYPFGILGPFFGKVGTVTGYTWKTIPVMRSLPSAQKIKKTPTPKQAHQRRKMSFITKFLSPLSYFIKISFKEDTAAMTEFNKAISYNIANAVSGAYPDFKLHYDLVAVSRGSLPNAVLPEAKAEGNAIRFIWADNSGIGHAAATDKALVAVYNPANNSWGSKISGVQRADGSLVLPLTGFETCNFHTWLAFMSEEGTVADSVYTGEVVLG